MSYPARISGSLWLLKEKRETLAKLYSAHKAGFLEVCFFWTLPGQRNCNSVFLVADAAVTMLILPHRFSNLFKPCYGASS